MVPIRVFGSSGGTSLAILTEAINYASQKGFPIINFSIGSVVYSSTEEAIKNYPGFEEISGFDYSKAFMIITEDRDELKEAIVNDIKRGVTILDGKGGYTNNDKSILLVVVNNKKQEVSLKKLIKKVDPSAFIIVSDVHEVLGEGFKSIAA